MADILWGAPAAEALSGELARRVQALRGRGTVPVLAVVRVGGRPDAAAYERSILKRCAGVGIDVRRHLLAEDGAGERLPETVRGISADGSVHGCLMLSPLGDAALEAEARALLAPEKDVDGMTALSLAAVFTGTGPGYPPCTPRACLELLDYYRIPLAGRRAVVIGRSLVVGRPLAMMLQARDATVTLCHSQTQDLPALTRQADILISAAGRPGLVTGDMVKPGAAVIDVAMNRTAEGRLCGDADPSSVGPVAGWLTPVPGGVGPMTRAMLLQNVLRAAQLREHSLTRSR